VSTANVLLAQRVIPVVAKAGASKTELLGVRNGALHIAVAAPPEDGKANAALEKFLSKQTGKTCRLVTGGASRKKLFRCE
jgi:uncharacterized protein (TIGR00251 family)